MAKKLILKKKAMMMIFAKKTAQKMTFSIKDFFIKCDQIRRKLWIWSHLLKKPLMENFIFCAVEEASQGSSSRFSDEVSNAKRKYVPTPTSRKKFRGQTESLLTEMKETMNTHKTRASNTSYKKILDFLKEESQMQAARDDAFLKIISA